MLVICGFCGFNLSFFHLFIHGFFKAMLFLLAGTVIHFVLDEQDFRKFNNLFFFFPVTYIFFLIASLSLSGFPFSSGFYSKDLILESIFNFQYKFSNFFFFFLNILTLLSAFYSFRLIFKSFLATPIQTMYFFFSNTNSFQMFTIINLLMIFCIFFGFITYSFFSVLSQFFFFNDVTNYIFFDFEFNSIFLKLLPNIFVFLSFFFFYFLLNNFDLILLKQMFNYLKNWENIKIVQLFQILRQQLKITTLELNIFIQTQLRKNIHTNYNYPPKQKNKINKADYYPHLQSYIITNINNYPVITTRLLLKNSPKPKFSQKREKFFSTKIPNFSNKKISFFFKIKTKLILLFVLLSIGKICFNFAQLLQLLSLLKFSQNQLYNKTFLKILMQKTYQFFNIIDKGFTLPFIFGTWLKQIKLLIYVKIFNVKQDLSQVKKDLKKINIEKEIEKKIPKNTIRQYLQNFVKICFQIFIMFIFLQLLFYIQ